ncbi:MAG: GTPase domain-containing protein [Planctomycetota bacterium]
MTQINSDYSKKTHWRVIYYGPPQSGKSSSLQAIFHQTPFEKRGEKFSINTQPSSDFVYDFMSFKTSASSDGFKFQLYSVPGNPSSKTIRKFLLQDADGIVMVIDSQIEKWRENRYFLKELQCHLHELGKNFYSIPLLFQYNKRDLPNIMDLEELNRTLNLWNFPYVETVANQGIDVFKTLTILTKFLSNKKKASATQVFKNSSSPFCSAEKMPVF